MRELPTEEERKVRQPEPGFRPRPVGAHAAREPRRRWVLGLITALIAAGLVTVWWFGHRRAQQEAGMRPAGGRRSGGGMNGPLPVAAQPARKSNLNVYLDGLGTVTPLAMVAVQTQISGQLMEVDFKEGQMVQKGDLLAVVDPRPYQVALEQAQGQFTQAQAQLEAARADLERYVKLAGQDSIAKQQVDDQQALVGQDTGLVQTDQAAIDSAKLNLTYCHITAPVSGRVGLRQIDPGNYVTPSNLSNGLVVITQVSPTSVIFTLPEDSIPAVAARLKNGDPIKIDAYDRADAVKIASGTLATIDNQVDSATGTFKLRATFANEDASLFANQFVNIHMLLKTDRGVTVIPTSAIEQGQNGTFVYIIKPDSTVAAQNVTTGPTEGERVEVTNGLKPGDRVVTDGADRLKDGMKVVVQSAAGGPGGNRAHRHHPANGGGGQSWGQN
jgi:multidrug efflux system membrane fusion protein